MFIIRKILRRAQQPRRNQSGITLLEFLLTTIILGAFLTAVTVLMREQEKRFQKEATAAYIDTVLKATSEYVKNHYNTVISEININNTTLSSPFTTIDIKTDLIDKGYLAPKFSKTQTPYRNNLEVRILRKQDSLHIFALHPAITDISIFDATNVASLVSHGYGGIYYVPTSTPNYCTVNNTCILGSMGLWLWQDNLATGELWLSNDFVIAFNGFIPTGNNVAIVGHIKLVSAGSPFLYREAAWGDLSANTLNTNLNLSKKNSSGAEERVGLIFNPTINSAGNFSSGTRLSYEPPSMVADSSDLDRDGNTTELIYNFANDSGSIVLIDYSFPANLQPTLSAEGGISTGLLIEKDSYGNYPASCSPNGILAVNEEDEFIICVSGNWTETIRPAVVRSTAVPPATASAYWLLIVDSTGQQYQIITTNLTDIPAGHTLVQRLGYIE